jgi:Fe-S cluster assembly iron-binding protein IscA
MTVQDETATSTATHGVLLTDAAASKAKALLDQEGRDDLFLRIQVEPGGCAGLKYSLFFIEKQGFTIDNPNATGSCACGDSFN